MTHRMISDLREANNRAHDRKVRLSAALIQLIEHFERVDAPEADRRAIHSACQVWAGVRAEDVLDGRSAADPYALKKAIANLRDSIAEEIPFGLTYVNSDDLAVVMDAVEQATPARAEAQSDDLRTACKAVLDDYQTSEAHHPAHILIRRTDFDRIKALVEAPVVARAEALDEGAAGEASAYRVRMISDDPAEWVLMHPEKALDFLSRKGWESQPLYAHPSPTLAADAVRSEPDDPTETMIQAGLKVDFDNEDERGAVINLWHVMKAAAPPAADADRVRIAVEALEVKINAPLTGPTHGAWDRGRIAGLKEALAALKSEALK